MCIILKISLELTIIRVKLLEQLVVTLVPVSSPLSRGLCYSFFFSQHTIWEQPLDLTQSQSNCPQPVHSYTHVLK